MIDNVMVNIGAFFMIVGGVALVAIVLILVIYSLTIFAATARERTAGMAKQSGMIAFAEQFAQAKVDAAQRLISQYMIDTLQMTLHQTEGWGYERIMRLTEAWQQTQKEYTPALNSNDPAADVCQEHMDRILAEIIRDRMTLIPFPDRYHELRKVTYGRQHDKR